MIKVILVLYRTMDVGLTCSQLYVFRRGSRIQKGGGGFVPEFQERIQIVAGPWANQQATTKLQTAVGGGGGGSDHPKKNLDPRLVF